VAPGARRILLLDDQGEATELLVPDDVLRAAGGRRAVNGRQYGRRPASSLPGGRAGPFPPRVQPCSHGAQALASRRCSGRDGPAAVVTILCRFADEPPSRRAPAWFESLSSAAPRRARPLLARGLLRHADWAASWSAGTRSLSPGPLRVRESLQLDHSRAASDCTPSPAAVLLSRLRRHQSRSRQPRLLPVGRKLGPHAGTGIPEPMLTWLPPWGLYGTQAGRAEMGHGSASRTPPVRTPPRTTRAGTS